MDKLIAGIAEFQKTGFLEHKELFKALASTQQPEALLITCADSRIDPNLITQTQPGDLFVCRNAGNIVPPHTDSTSGMTASIEYALSVLNVPHVIVCGHTNCGAMKGALHPESVQSLPHVSRWLGHCSAAVSRLKARHGELGGEHLLEMIQENVLLQMKHLETHPSVAAKLATGEVELHGWVYDIEKGTVHCYDVKQDAFIPIADCYPAKTA